MKVLLSAVIAALIFNCINIDRQQIAKPQVIKTQIAPDTFAVGSWQYFLQHLPLKDGQILDYKGKRVSNQAKHVAIINYDVTADLQQCADALMQLRSEYLFAQNRYKEIGFHFCSEQFYSWNMYCEGLRPKMHGNSISWTKVLTCEKNHTTLRISNYSL